MTESQTNEKLSRGARRRRRRAARKERDKALAWWTQPGVLTFLAVVALATLGIAMVVRAIDRRPVQQATIGGLSLQMLEARWLLDQMDHGENFQKPSTMMPDMPEWGKQRVTLDLTFRNEASNPQVYDGREFFLVPEIGDEVMPYGANVGSARLAPGQTLNAVIHFDFDTTQPHGKLRVAWRRAGETVYLPVPEPAEHYHLRPRGGEISLPADARLLLPIGKADRGEVLFMGRFGCYACHGDPNVAGSNIIGPHLGNIGIEGGARIEGVPAHQYIYEAILDPNAFIAPECQNGQPCATPTAMPEYASLMTLENAADLLAFLLEQKRQEEEGE